MHVQCLVIASVLSFPFTGVCVAIADTPDAELTGERPATPMVAPEASTSAEVTATIVLADGSPVEGAVVVTSAGGQGVSGREGAVRFSLDVATSLERAQVTAVATVNGVNHVGSVAAELAGGHRKSLAIQAGTIVLSADGECEPAWLPTFGGGPGVTGGYVSAMTVFDDGNGPALYVGGGLTAAGNEPVNGIARWDGFSWSPLGSGLDGWVRELAVFDDGSGPALYAGGQFTTAGGVQADRIAKWDGSSWSPLNSGVSSTVWALNVVDEGSATGATLYAGGSFNDSPAGDSYLAKWKVCPVEPKCALGDLNCDGVVDVSDLLILLAAWGECPLSGECPADLNGDEAVDVSDLLILLANWA